MEQIGTVDSQIVAEVQRKAALQALFRSMLKQLMTGQVRVRDLALPLAAEAGRAL